MSPVNDKSREKDSLDLRTLSSRRPSFDWGNGIRPEIPIGLSCLGEHVPYSDAANPNALVERMEWSSLQFPHKHIHVELVFSHRPLIKAKITYDEAEGL